MAPKFNLQNVLDIRHSKVEALEIDLARMLSQQLAMESQLLILRDFQINLMMQLAQAQQGDVDIVASNLLRFNIMQTDERIRVARQELQAHLQAVEEKRNELVRAKQSEETLQILKRKGIETYNAELAMKEASAQDDIYIARAFRQRQIGAL